MKVVRFMGEKEFNDLLAGKPLHNTTDWERAGKATNARGFCFFRDDEPKERRIHYMPGVYSYYVVFNVLGPVNFKVSQGLYRDLGPGPYDDIIFISGVPIGRRKVFEFSLEDYSRQLLGIAEAYAIEMDIDAGDWAFRRIM